MPERSESRLGTEPMGKLVLSMAMPSVLAQLVNLLYSIVDRVYVGHIADIGALALTGLGLCTPLILIVSAFAYFAGSGGAPRAAMELGRGDREKAGLYLAQGLLMVLVSAAVLTPLLLWLRMPLLRFFGASDDTIGFADQYIKIYLCGTVFVQLALGLNTFISAQGQAKTAMLSVVIGAAANIILDPIFIFLFDMGVAGAALATVISQAVSAAWVLWFLLSKRSVLPLSLRAMKPDFAVIGSIASLGVSPFIMQVTECLIAIVFTNGLQRYGGDLYVGSYTILQSVMQLMYVPAHGFTNGVQPIVSYNYGAGDYGRVKRCFWLTLAAALGYTAAFYVLIAAFPNFFAGLFTPDAALRALSAEKLPIYLAGMAIFGLQMSVQCVFVGTGQAKVSLFIACLRKVILLTPLALILPLFWKVDGIYFAEPVSDTLSALTSAVLFAVMSRRMFHKTDVMERLQEQGYRSGMESGETDA